MSMFSSVIPGVVALAIMAGSMHFSVFDEFWKPKPDKKPAIAAAACKTKQIAVPVLIKSSIKGYLVFQLAFPCAGKGDKAVDQRIELELTDAALKLVYSRAQELFDDLQKLDLALISSELTKGVSSLGETPAGQVRFTEFNFVPKSDVR
jgi:hypothetical protein